MSGEKKEPPLFEFPETLNQRYIQEVPDVNASIQGAIRLLADMSIGFDVDVSPKSPSFQMWCVAYVGNKRDKIEFSVSWYTLPNGKIVQELHRYAGDSIPGLVVISTLGEKMGMPVQAASPYPPTSSSLEDGDVPKIVWEPTHEEVKAYVEMIDDSFYLANSINMLTSFLSATHVSNIPLCLLCEKVIIAVMKHMSKVSSDRPLDTDVLRNAAMFFTTVYNSVDCVNVMAPLKPHPGVYVVDLLMNILNVAEAYEGVFAWEVNYQALCAIAKMCQSCPALIPEFLSAFLEDRVLALCNEPCARVVKVAQEVRGLLTEFHAKADDWAASAATMKDSDDDE